MKFETKLFLMESIICFNYGTQRQLGKPTFDKVIIYDIEVYMMDELIYRQVMGPLLSWDNGICSSWNMLWFKRVAQLQQTFLEAIIVMT